MASQNKKKKAKNHLYIMVEKNLIIQNVNEFNISPSRIEIIIRR